MAFMNKVLIMVLFLVATSCLPKEDLQFKKVRNIVLTASGTTPLLQGDLLLFNPNDKRMKLKKLDLVVMLNGKQAGVVDQKLRQEIPANDEFTVPIEVVVSLKEIGLLDAISSILGGKKNIVRIRGKIRGSVNGMTISVPVDYTEEIRIKR
jgi:LEA14-like dessication related protein